MNKLEIGMYVRTKDGIITKVDNIYLNANYENKRICSSANDCETELATYGTKERALEVLDEIQKYILLPNPDGSAYVYQMPVK